MSLPNSSHKNCNPPSHFSPFSLQTQRWNLLVLKPSFHDLWDMNARKDNYLFITRYVIYSDWCYVDPSFMKTLSFLDLADQRWYTIKTGMSTSLGAADEFFLNDQSDTRLLAMDDGLFCDLTGIDRGDKSSGTPIVVFNPVSRMSTKLRAPPTCCPSDALPIIAMVADNATRSYRVFFVDNCTKAPTRMYVYESLSKTWRGLKNPPKAIGVTAALSAVFFRRELYIVFQTDAWNKFVVLSYNLQEDMWRQSGVSLPDKPSHPQLVAHGDRLFLTVWSFISNFCRLGHNHPNSSYEVIEILVPENISKRVLQISTEQLHASFVDEGLTVDIAYGIPLLDSAGTCSSVILVSSLTGKTINYNSVSGSVTLLPAHPLGSHPCLEEVDYDGLPVTATFAGKHMNLSLRNLLSI